ncbi:MAG: hypothetical protein ABIT20_24750 [Gemmatimonadaceae bacterium]
MSIRRNVARISGSAMLVLTAAHTSFAQQMEPVAASSRLRSTETAFSPSAESQVTTRPVNMWGGVAGRVLGGGAGFFGGMMLGASEISRRSCTGEDCGLANAIIGSMIGESVGLAVGAHYGSRGRGNLAIQMLTSTAIGAAGLYSAWYAEGAAPIILGAVPVVQLLAVMAMEK